MEREKEGVGEREREGERERGGRDGERGGEIRMLYVYCVEKPHLGERKQTTSHDDGRYSRPQHSKNDDRSNILEEISLHSHDKIRVRMTHGLMLT